MPAVVAVEQAAVEATVLKIEQAAVQVHPDKEMLAGMAARVLEIPAVLADLD
jgi:hypothetical protein